MEDNNENMDLTSNNPCVQELRIYTNSRSDKYRDIKNGRRNKKDPFKKYNKNDDENYYTVVMTGKTKFYEDA